MKEKKVAVLDRIKRIEEAIARGHEYLESGNHANWSQFQPLFAAKFRDGVKLPPHKDWVKNVFIPGMEKELVRAEKILDRMDP
jgi:hypothetical protein